MNLFVNSPPGGFLTSWSLTITGMILISDQQGLIGFRVEAEGIYGIARQTGSSRGKR